MSVKHFCDACNQESPDNVFQKFIMRPKGFQYCFELCESCQAVAHDIREKAESDLMTWLIKSRAQSNLVELSWPFADVQSK